MPSLIAVCRPPAAARNISGEAIISQPRVVLAAPELVESEPVEVRGELEIALELQRRILAERVVRSQERAEPELHPRKLLPGHRARDEADRARVVRVGLQAVAE